MTDVREAPAPASSAKPGQNPQGDFIWYELVTPDPDGAKAFYDSVVGWSIDETSQFPNGYRMIKRSDGGNAGGLLPLTDDMRQHGARPIWLGYVFVEDVDDTARKAQALGGHALMPPFDIPGIGRVALIADAGGAPIYVMKPIPPAENPDARSDVFSPDQPQRVSWNELSAADPEAARPYYRELFGWTDDDFMDMGDMGKYRFLFNDGQRIGAMCGTMDGGQPRWRYYIRVPSIETAKSAVEANGGSIAMGPHEVPGGDWIVIGKDPQGAEFALVGAK